MVTLTKGWLFRTLDQAEKRCAEMELDELRYQIPIAEHAADAAEDYVHKLKKRRRTLLRLLDNNDEQGELDI